ncbi:MAG: NAD(P)/FAD-dependent oxidoreductase [Burkholderiaceae bacterium]
MNIAVIGSGIAGLSCAWRLTQSGHGVTLFEADDSFGGHTHTVDVALEGRTCGVDTGFLVFNHRTYPNLVRLFGELDVETAASDMSFSVRLPTAGGRMLEWAGSNLDTVFAQRRNLLSPVFLGMLRDILRFNRQATAMALADDDAGWEMPLSEFLDRHRYGTAFRDWYLLPMAGCIWSCPTRQMLAFPVATFVRFCHNHGLLQVNDRPQWHTVRGGARHYVERMLEAIPRRHLRTPVRAVLRTALDGVPQVAVDSALGTQVFDHAVLASHSDQSLALLKDADEAETAVLSAVRYQPNRALLHTDASLLPLARRAWSAWNYESRGGAEPDVCVHYLINRLQPLPFATPVIVSLNPVTEPRRETVLGEFEYAHPVFDAKAVSAQRALPSIQGARNVWFAGAWTGYGFHEDGLKSGLAAAEAIDRVAASALAQRAAA